MATMHNKSDSPSGGSLPVRDLFFRHVAQTSPFPLGLEIVRAEGLYMIGSDGTEYLDLISGISVSALGHRHPRVVEAVCRQMERYMHLMVYGEFVQSPQAKLAGLLAGNLPPSLDNVYFVNSGSEAVEGAIKLAKRFTGRTGLVAFDNAYHGSSHGALSVTGSEGQKRPFRPLLPDVRHIPFGSAEALDAIDARTACVIAETIQGEAGVVVPGKDFMQALRKRCDETGALLILDEIQTGMGRCGSLWAFTQFGCIPDILTLAKGLGGGLPLGAFIARKQVMECLSTDPILGHITTFGGNAVCAAAAAATLETIVEEKLWENALQQEKRFRELLRSDKIISIRGKGLLLGLEFADFRQCKAVVDKCIANGLLTDWFLFAPQCMRIAPPLTITDREVERACTVIRDSVDKI